MASKFGRIVKLTSALLGLASAGAVLGCTTTKKAETQNDAEDVKEIEVIEEIDMPVCLYGMPTEIIERERAKEEEVAVPETPSDETSDVQNPVDEPEVQ